MNNELYLHNSLTNKKELFVPLTPGKVTFYVCGVTVYDYCHIGHARAYVIFDTMRRFLEYLGYKVTYIQNFTDIDDKIINKANGLNLPIQELTQKYITAYFEDMDKLNINRANKYPKATEYILEIQKIIADLMVKEIAYQSNDGDICFEVDKFINYGKLSKKRIDDLKSGIRIAIEEGKKSPLDFVLWKKAKDKEPSWDSPWGKGRPGWHIECSAMALTELGETIDIHAGGEDLIFPHHENEIAQSESYTQKPFANFWLHNGFVNINAEKMSKSKQNFFTIREILTQFSAEVIRFFLLRVHYRSPINFTHDALEEAKRTYQKFINTLQAINFQNIELVNDPILIEFENHFKKAMNNDFNFSEALSVLFEINKYTNIHHSPAAAALLIKLGNILGLFQNINFKEEALPQQISKLIEERTLAKKEKNYQRADEIKRELLTLGIQLEDTPSGVRWKHQG
ncbi:MAG: cysteine--tRNA ligase [Candidatus Margulisiibacteriota bacterium]|jgi:cysteinyl-tRNA synthetase